MTVFGETQQFTVNQIQPDLQSDTFLPNEVNIDNEETTTTEVEIMQQKKSEIIRVVTSKTQLLFKHEAS